MARRKYKRRKSSASPWAKVFGFLLIILVAVAIGAVLYFAKSLKDQQVTLRSEDGCPKSRPPSEIAVLIVDATDPLNNIQHLSVHNLLDRVVAQIPRYGAFAIYTVSSDKFNGASPVFFRCNPGRGEEISEWTENPKMIEWQWKEGFRAPLDEELGKSLRSGAANSSPILESIQWASLQRFENTNPAKTPHKLVIISDFHQHTNQYSHYRQSPNFSQFEKSEYYRKIRASLTGASVSLWFVHRKSRVSSELLKEFWKNYFRAQGASEVRINDLAG